MAVRVRPFAIERWFARYEFTTEINVAETSIKPLTTREILALAGLDGWPDEVLGRRLGYLESNGTPALREAVSRYVPNTPPDQVLVTIGAIEADYLVSKALVRPGDTVITQFPMYQALYSVAEALGARVKRWLLREEDGYRPDLDALVRLLDDRTRLVVVNHPQNPTGSIFTREELQALCDLAAERGFYLLCDEVYYGLWLNHSDRPAPMARALDPRAVHVGSASKALAAPGLRIGWVAGPPEVIQACWEQRDYTSLCNPWPSEFLATILLTHHERVMDRSLRLARTNFRIFDGWVREHQAFVSYVPPRAGVVCFPRYHLDLPSEEFCHRLIEEEGVLTIPGSCFEQEGHFRLGFGYDTDRLEEALGRMSRFFHRHRG